VLVCSVVLLSLSLHDILNKNLRNYDKYFEFRMLLVLLFCTKYDLFTGFDLSTPFRCPNAIVGVTMGLIERAVIVGDYHWR